MTWKHRRRWSVGWMEKSVPWKTSRKKRRNILSKRPSSIIKWKKPPQNWAKLNVDGSARGNPGLSGGGGVCRREDGSVVFAFSKGYGLGTNNMAELRAIYDGLSQCLQRGLSRVEIESDSKLLIDVLEGKADPHWKWQPWIKRILSLKSSISCHIQHIHREGNGPADVFAKEGSRNQRDVEYDHLRDMPSQARGLIFLDKIGLGYVTQSDVILSASGLIHQMAGCDFVANGSEEKKSLQGKHSR